MYRPTTRTLALLALLIPGSTPADPLIAPPAPGSLAFARYIASLHQRDPFSESGPVSLVIEASLPGLGKKGRLVAVRETGDSERSEYKVLESDGDAAVTQEVIAPYLAEQKEIENRPLSSVIITPANYKFRFLRGATIDNTSTAIFRIEPKNKREGLIQGQLWIDSATGLAVMQAGYFVKTSSAGIRRIEMVRDTKLRDGFPISRITRIAIETRRAGRGYLTITECPPAATSAVVRAKQSAGRTVLLAFALTSAAPIPSRDREGAVKELPGQQTSR
jgi:hypothetical protein